MTVAPIRPTLAEELTELLAEHVPGPLLERVLLELFHAGPDGSDDELRHLLENGAVSGTLRLHGGHGFQLVGVRALDHYRLLSRLRLHSQAYRQQIWACVADRTVWLLVGGAERKSPLRALADVELHHELALTRNVDDLRLVPAYRASIDRLLDVGERCGWRGAADTGQLDATRRMEALLDMATCQPEVLDGPLTALFETPAHHALAHTLYAWFEHDRDAAATAAALHLHVNTVRYRLRRAVEIADIDLGDWDQRLLSQMQLRAWQAGGGARVRQLTRKDKTTGRSTASTTT